jgi:hypothetical protein
MASFPKKINALKFVKPALYVLMFAILISLFFRCVFDITGGIISGIAVIIVSICLSYKFGVDRFICFVVRMMIYCISSGIVYIVISNTLNHSTIMYHWIVFIATIVLLYIIRKVIKSEERLQIISNSILSAICFGMLPFLLYFSSFSMLSNEFVNERYIANSEIIQDMFNNTDILVKLDGLDRSIFRFEDMRTFSESVKENSAIFLEFCDEEESVERILNEYQQIPLDLYNYFSKSEHHFR